MQIFAAGAEAFEGTEKVFDLFLHEILGESLVDVNGTGGHMIMETYSFLGVRIEMC